MLNNLKMGKFICEQRKRNHMTQQKLADELGITFQAVSKWENGIVYPNIEILPALSQALHVSVDDLLKASISDKEALSYDKAGVDISYSDSLKKDMSKLLVSEDKRVLNGVGPFASLYDINFEDIENPVLILKSEEPGSKQKLAMEYGYTESICHDMVNHLVNDVIVMGAKPLAVLDTIVCGKAEKDTINAFIKGIANACKENECSLVGGETSIQPQVVQEGTYILSSTIAGIADRTCVIDGHRIKDGDIVLAIESNGVHTNGYSLIRLLMDKHPEIKLEKVEELTFVEQIMKPHTPYYQCLKEFFGKDIYNGLAHITGGGIQGNLSRIIPDGLCARIDLSSIEILPIFNFIKKQGNISNNEMLNTFNCGVGMCVVLSPEYVKSVQEHIGQYYNCYPIGKVEKGQHKVDFYNELLW
ncbi:MAG: phosphoribosylformylglycinamidine cyclo-ligase [Lachnospiraceae bacterium]|nr:phosphoribosylformylglycinamidine cyclo-ligase [Lachnospiraceae bacterium]